MKKFTKYLAVILTGLGLVLAGCSSASDVASKNISAAADNFEIERRIIFVNGITDKYLLTIEGKCSINDQGNQLEVTCKLGEDKYFKHFLGLSDNVTYFAEQLEGANVDPFHYRVVIRPETILPDPDLQTSGG